MNFWFTKIQLNYLLKSKSNLDLFCAKYIKKELYFLFKKLSKLAIKKTTFIFLMNVKVKMIFTSFMIFLPRVVLCGKFIKRMILILDLDLNLTN